MHGPGVPPGCEPPGIGFLAAGFAVALIFIGLALWVMRSSDRHERESGARDITEPYDSMDQ